MRLLGLLTTTEMSGSECFAQRHRAATTFGMFKKDAIGPRIEAPYGFRHTPRKRGIQYAGICRLTSAITGSPAFADDDEQAANRPQERSDTGTAGAR